MSSLRDKIRADVLQTRAPKRKKVDFFGTEIEIVQPTLGDIVAAQQSESREAAVIDILTKYAVVPGTDERIFEEADADMLKTQPFGHDQVRVAEALQELTDVDFQAKNSTSGKIEANT